MSSTKRTTAAQARALVAKKWDAHHSNWLAGAGGWPLALNLHSLTEKDVISDLAGTREWVSSWRQWPSDAGHVEWQPRRWSSGDQELPARLVVASAEDAASIAGKAREWERAKARYARICSEFPSLCGTRALLRWCDDVLAAYSENDFSRLLSLLAWFSANPQSGLYLRQLPIANLDTKWVESRRGVVGDLVRQLLGLSSETPFLQACGLRAEPNRLRVRVLCPQLRRQVGGLCDIEAPAAELAHLGLRPSTCLVVENLNTGIALPDLPGTVAFMRLGLAVDQLDAIGWLQDTPRQLYWGDLDTHGFAALSRARKRLTRLESLLMDERTLLDHRELWVREDKPSRVEVLERLVPAEQAVYEGLRANRWGDQIRLEQERISWPQALAALAGALGQA